MKHKKGVSQSKNIRGIANKSSYQALLAGNQIRTRKISADVFIQGYWILKK